MSNSAEFTEAADKVQRLNTKPSDSDLLVLYGLYKQASVGDVNTGRPGMFDLKGKAKWDAWNGNKGVSREEAEQRYIAKVNDLVQAHGLN
jgi:diazepam-binding inhibitor (GABA receptor modulating acyl-CoA-binding protein)